MRNQRKLHWWQWLLAVFAVIKEQRATALFPVWLFIAYFPTS
jgi:hypothetical protein